MVDKLTIGNAEIGFALDMIPPSRPPGDFFPDVEPEAWAPYADDVLAEGQIQLYYGHFFVRSQGKTIMVDTGIGPGPHPTRGNIKGDLMNQLALRGVKPDDVDVVVHTHLHIDHVGWNLDLSGPEPKPFFPNARYLAPRTDWEYFIQPEVLEKAPWVRDSVVPLEGMGLLDFFEEGHAITSEVTTLATPGHTPGHQAILVSSGGQRAAIVGDAIHSKVQVQEPAWCAGVDTDKADSTRSREGLLKMSEAEGYLIAAGHFHPDEHVGRVVLSNGKRYWQGI